MQLLNMFGSYGTVKQLQPEWLSPTVEDLGFATLFAGAVGTTVVTDLHLKMRGDSRYDEEALSSIIGIVAEKRDVDGKTKTFHELVQLYGVTFFECPEGEWRDLVQRFKADPASFKAVHPRKLRNGTRYLFFARRAKHGHINKRRRFRCRQT